MTQYVAEVLSTSRDLRVVVSSSNIDSDNKVVADEPALTRAQIADIALNQIWGFNLPATNSWPDGVGSSAVPYVDLGGLDDPTVSTSTAPAN